MMNISQYMDEIFKADTVRVGNLALLARSNNAIGQIEGKI